MFNVQLTSASLSHRTNRNPGGIRFGSAEIYDVLDAFTRPQHTPTLVDYLAVGQKTEGGADERVVLFVKLGQGEKLDAEFEGTIKKTIRSRRSARHVPARVSLFRQSAYSTTLLTIVITPLCLKSSFHSDLYDSIPPTP